MTGFGKGSAENSQGRVSIEIKSLNHKYFDIVSRFASGFLVFEDRIKTAIQKHVKRGRINITLEYDDFTKKDADARIDIVAARRYAKQLKNLKKALGLSGEITVQQIMSMPGIITNKPKKIRPESQWPLVKTALEKAQKQLLTSKIQEGKATKTDLLKACRKIENALKLIKHQVVERKKRYRAKLTKNIKSITGKKNVRDRERLEEEIAIFARNSDISEEVMRIDAHLKAFKKAASNSKEIGRRLDFIAQEISREANTIGAKANYFRIARETIKIKSLVEKIREQTQNVE